MKRTLATIAVSIALTVSAQATNVWDSALGFLNNNPSGVWDLSVYGLKNTTTSEASVANGFGFGMRAGYWVKPMIGVSADFSYCDSTWTFASLGLNARATITLAGKVDVTPYVVAGPGWTMSGSLEKEICAVAGTGVSVKLKAKPQYAIFGEYMKVMTSPEQNRIQIGATVTF